MSTPLEQMHEIEPLIRIRRARAGVLMLILSDTLSVLAILAAGGYLSSLNVMGQYKAGASAPTFLPGLLLAISLVLSGLAYYWWERVSRGRTGSIGRTFFIVAWVLMIVTLIGQVWVSATLGYAQPFHAYVSLILLLSWYSAFHLLLASVIGLLMMGRLARGRQEGYDYIVEVVGYWWYYTVIAGLLMWLGTLLL